MTTASQIEYLISEFENEDTDKLQEAIAALGQIGAEAIAPLIEAFTSESEAIRYNAIFALAAIGETAVEPLIAALNDENRNIQMFSSGTLGELKDARAIEPLIKMLETEETGIFRSWVGLALSGFGQEIIPILVAKIAASDNPVLKRGAAYVLGHTKSNEAIPHLIALTKETNIRVRVTVIQALARFEEKEAVDTLFKLTYDESPKIRAKATEYLAKVVAKLVRNDKAS